jgi:hypothetical protein
MLPLARTFIDPKLSGGGPGMDIGVNVRVRALRDGATLNLECSWLQHQKEKEDMSVVLFGRERNGAFDHLGNIFAVNGALIDGLATAPAPVSEPRTDQIVTFARAIRGTVCRRRCRWSRRFS